MGPGEVLEFKVEKKYALKAAKVQVMVHFHLVDQDGNIVAETSAQPVTLFPDKFDSLARLVAKVVEEANKKEEDIKVLAANSEF